MLSYNIVKDGETVNNKVLGNRYQLMEKIGEGGMANVYTARCQILNRIVAVKILKDEFSTDEEFVNKFKNEAQAAASLNHPNIINVYDVGQDNGISYIVMEYVDGINLKELIKKEGALEEQRAINIVKQIALALSEAHSKKIIHRDIKPHNIMITKDNMVKVGDFGIAKAVNSSTITSVGAVMVSVHYFSPEQARGGYMDERSDIYSLGIVLYELLTGKLPFSGETPVNVALKHIHSKVELGEEDFANVSQDAQNLILKMTQRNVDRRYKNVEQLVADISSLEQKKPINNFIEREEDFETKRILFGHQELDFSDDYEEDYDDEEIDMKPNKKSKIADRKPKRKHTKTMSIFAIIAALVASLVFLATVFIFSGGELLPSNVFGIFSSNKIDTPSLLGKTLEEAEEEAAKLGLKVEMISEEPNSKYAEGTISKQEPTEGVKVNEGETIKVVISKALAETVSVPSVEGMKLTEALELLESKNLQEAVEYEFTDQEEDIILSQSPAAGESVEERSIIKLKVSRGPEEILEMVPSLVGKSLEDAKANIGNFKVGELSYNEDKSKKDGVVLSQIPKADTEAKKGSEINLVINRLEKEEQPQTIKTSMAIMLPEKETVALQIKDLSTGAVVYNQTIRPADLNGILIVDIIGKNGETKDYEIYIDGQYYTTQQVAF